jgi:hypothetical protein
MSSPVPITLALVAYNKADVVGLALDSAARGSRRPDLVVLSDDGSDDGTPDVAARAAARLGLPCLVLRHPRVGVYRIQAMRNACVAHALDGVVVLSDSDCLFGEHSIESHAALHQRHPRAVGSGPRFEFLHGAAGPFTSTGTTLEYGHAPEAMHSVAVGANYSFRKRLWRELGGFDRAFDGSYGLEEFEFTARALRAGAACVTDPGAHVFHVPHDTVFGGRAPSRNVRVFDAKFGVDHSAQEGDYLRRHAVPYYWAGHRKAPLCAGVELDDWGAPPGFTPPFHLALSRSLAPLVAMVRAALAPGAAALQALRGWVYGVDNRWLGPGSAALHAAQDLQRILACRPRAEVDRRLRDWLAAAQRESA